MVFLVAPPPPILFILSLKVGFQFHTRDNHPSFSSSLGHHQALAASSSPFPDPNPWLRSYRHLPDPPLLSSLDSKFPLPPPHLDSLPYLDLLSDRSYRYDSPVPPLYDSFSFTDWGD